MSQLCVVYNKRHMYIVGIGMQCQPNGNETRGWVVLLVLLAFISICYSDQDHLSEFRGTQWK